MYEAPYNDADDARRAWKEFRAQLDKALARAIPNAHHRALEDQTHEVTAEALAPVLVEFFKG